LLLVLLAWRGPIALARGRLVAWRGPTVARLAMRSLLLARVARGRGSWPVALSLRWLLRPVAPIGCRLAGLLCCPRVSSSWVA